MKKVLLPLLGLAALLGTATEAQAQANLIHGISAGIGLARMAANKKPDAPVINTETHSGKAFPMRRTPADQLPKKGTGEVTALETQLDRFHSALVADSTSSLCTPEQRTAIQTAMVNLARAQPRWDLQPYQQEAAFYFAEDARRQKAASPAK